MLVTIFPWRLSLPACDAGGARRDRALRAHARFDSTILNVALPALATALDEHFWWGSIFLVNVPVAVIALDAVLGELPPDEAGSGTAVTMTLRQTGGALGVALLGSLLSAVYRSGAALPGSAREPVTATLAAAARTGDAALATAARTAYVDAMAAVLLACAGLTLAGAVLAAFLLPARGDAVGTAGAAAEESVHEPARPA